MTDTPTRRGCPFHQEATKVAKHEGGGLPYNKLRQRIAAEGLSAVLGGMDEASQRAVASSYLTESFWSVFQANHAIDHKKLKEQLNTEPRYRALLSAANDTVVKTMAQLLNQPGTEVTAIQREARERLADLVSEDTIKGHKWTLPEEYLLNEIGGALSVLINLFEVIDELYQKERGEKIPADLFKKTLSSPEFTKAVIRLANGSEGLVSTIVGALTEKEGAERKFRAEEFSLKYPEGTRDYLILQIQEGFIEDHIARYDKTGSYTGEEKVRCPANDLRVESLYTGKNVSMVQATLEWCVEEVLAPYL